jgi:uncharacterized membrane protein
MLAIALWVSWPQTVSTQQISHKDANPASKTTALVADQTDKRGAMVSNERVMTLIDIHCVGCHSRTPTDDIFKVAPLGVVLDSWEDVERFAPQVVRRTTVTKDMPFLNKTKMTDEERQEIARWFAQRQK